MKKENKFSNLSGVELLNKQKALLKQLVSYKVSMDPSTITEANNVDGLRRDIKALQRQIALASSKKNVSVGG
jgi:hypothetical protein